MIDEKPVHHYRKELRFLLGLSTILCACTSAKHIYNIEEYDGPPPGPRATLINDINLKLGPNESATLTLARDDCRTLTKNRLKGRAIYNNARLFSLGNHDGNASASVEVAADKSMIFRFEVTTGKVRSSATCQLDLTAAMENGKTYAVTNQKIPLETGIYFSSAHPNCAIRIVEYPTRKIVSKEGEYCLREQHGVANRQ